MAVERDEPEQAPDLNGQDALGRPGRVGRDAAEASIRQFFVDLTNVNTAVLPREFVCEDPFVVDHIRTVCRMKPGEPLIVVDRHQPRRFLTVIESHQRNDVRLKLLEPLPLTADAMPVVTLGAALIKEQRWDWLIQKATELGVRHIVPVAARRSVVKLTAGKGAKKADRWGQILQSAAEQSEGGFIPTLGSPVSVEDWCAALPVTLQKWVLTTRQSGIRSPQDLLSAVAQNPAPEVVVAIGPEGGWTAGELNTFLAAGFQPLSLGRRILRSETAAVAILSLLAYAGGYEASESTPD
ncbi:MAG: 16S rRNA (uracil(1498)-N(3))-methyltransferase [Candidatus Melainabacteria bacterium]